MERGVKAKGLIEMPPSGVKDHTSDRGKTRTYHIWETETKEELLRNTKTQGYFFLKGPN